jgi:transposase-like protein
MITAGSKFTRKKEEAIAALLSQRNIEDAAKSIGIGTQTLLRWLKIPEFDEAYRKARRAAVSQIEREAATGDQRGGLDAAQDHGGPEHPGVHPGAGGR